MQAISGAGHPRVVNLDIIDNVIPFIKGEEPKVEIEPKKILGSINQNKIIFGEFKMNAQCNRVNVTDGHTECVQVTLKKKASIDDVIKSWENFKSIPQQMNLPLAPLKPIHYGSNDTFPQPKHQRDVDKGMAVSIGRLRKDSIFDYSFVILSHNTVRGAAGGAILCAELMKEKQFI